MDSGTIAGFRLSPQQEHLWSLQKTTVNPYRAQCAILIEGQLDEIKLTAAIGEIVRRHEILRTTFHSSMQLIHDVCEVKLNRHDLSNLSADEQQSELDGLFEEIKQTPIDPARLPLLQTTLTTLATDRAILLLSLPALCADAATLNSLMLEIGSAYDAQPIATEPLQYADLAEWQNELLAASESDIGKEFWRKQNFTAYPLAGDFAPQVFSLQVRIRTLAKLRALAELYDVSSELILLACWQILLWRLADQSDVTIAAAFDGRTDEELEGALGLLTKYLPLQGALEEHDRFDAVLQRTSQAHAEAKKWQQAFTRAGASFFPFCFEYASHKNHASWSIVKQNACIDRFQQKLSCLEHDESLTLEFHYDANVYAASEIEQRAEQYQKLLEGVINEPHAGIGELEIVTAGEWRRLIYDFNRTAVEFHGDKCIQHVFESCVARAPSQIAIIHEHHRITYEALNSRANKVANYLRDLGVGPETLVGICMDRGIDLVVGLLGILKAGGAYVPFDPDYPIERLAVMLTDAQAPVLLTQEHLLDNLPATASFTVLLDSDWDTIDGYDDANPQVDIQSDNAAYVIYTSGTTGKPKGVVVEHCGVINLAQWQADNFGITGESRVSQFASFSFDAAVGESFMALLNGATLVMLNRENLSPAELTRSINEEQINVCVMVPSVLKELDPDQLTNGKSLAVVAVGEICPPELALKWLPKCNFMNAYGPTEYTVYSHLWKVDETRVNELGCVPVGTPIHNAGTYILDPHLNPVPVGVSGEIYIAGPGIARGYLNHPDLTAQKFIPNSFEQDHEFSDGGVLNVDIDRDQFINEIAPHQNGLNGSHPIAHESVLELIKNLDADLVERTRVFMKTYDTDSASYQGFCRYLLEGSRDSYASCGINDEVLRLLFGRTGLNGLSGVDFGFGNAEIMQALQRLGASVVGLDFNPFFVQKGRGKGLGARMAKIDVPPQMFASETGLDLNSQDFAISTLVLDRLEKPRNLIENVFQVLKDDGRFAIQTLLPIVGVDDGEVAHRIVYTPEPDRIARGEDVEQDKLSLVSLLHSFGARDVQVFRLPYIVTSRDGVQEYTVWSFVGRKRNVAASRRSRMYKTGDRGRYLPDGTIEFRGRTDNQVKIRGFRIELDDIESALRAFHAVKDCVVTTGVGPDGAIRIVAYVVTVNRATEVDELQSYLKQKLPVHMIPAAFVLLDQMPLMPSGKLDRQALPTPEQYLATRKINYVAPRTPTEELLAAVWLDMLKLERVSVYDNFFDLGGHSLLATQVLSRLRQMFGVELLLRDLFKQPTIVGFAETIERERGAGRREEVPLRVAPRDGRLPLSFAQQRLWFINRMEPGSVAYNVPISLRLSGRLRVDVLERTLSEVVRRHESLRTGFALPDGETEPVQVINEARPMKLPLVDLSELEAQDVELSRLLQDDARRGFKLDEEPALRVTLLKLNETEHVVLFTMHHIVSDGWSMGVLVKEVAALYEAFAAGKPAPLLELSIQYADFAVWQREWLQGEVLDRQLSYWRRQLAGAPSVLELPADYARSSEPAFRGAHEPMSIPAELLRELKELGHREGTTLFMTLLAAWQTLLSRYSGQDDIVVGTPIANRNRAETEQLIGFFVNMIVLRTDLSGNPTFQELLGRVREKALEAYAHQDLPFEKLVEELQPERRGNHMPVFQIAFELQNAPLEDLKLKDLQISALPNGPAAPKIDLTLSAMENAGALDIVFTYNRDLFTQQTIKRMQRQFQILLAGIVANPQSHIADLPLSNEEDREMLSAAFSEDF